ncbi:MAG: MMPL family transporter [Trebonia sp.]
MSQSALAVMSQALKTSYDNSFTLAGTGSGTAQELLQRSAPAQAGDPDQIVWRVNHGSITDPAIEQRMSAMLARVSHLPEVGSVASPYQPGGKVQVSPDRRTAYATVNFTKSSDNLVPADISRVISVATAAREPGLAVELGGQAVSHSEQAPLSVPGVAAVQAAPSAGPTIEVTQVLPTTAPEAQATAMLISRLRSSVIPRYTRGTTLRVYVGGVTATFTDFAASTNAKLPWFLAAIAVFSFVLLVLAFRSLLIPAITAVANLLSAAASFGLLTAFFQWGWGPRPSASARSSRSRATCQG